MKQRVSLFMCELMSEKNLTPPSPSPDTVQIMLLEAVLANN